MEVVQIIGGGNLAVALKELGIEVVKVVQTSNRDLQVWGLSRIEYERFDEASSRLGDEELWDSDKYGWWRNGGSNIQKSEVIEIGVCDQTMKVYKNPRYYYHSEEYYADCAADGEEPDSPSFSDLFELCCEYYGASKLTNISCVVTDLAELNEMSKAQFVEAYATCELLF